MRRNRQGPLHQGKQGSCRLHRVVMSPAQAVDQDVKSVARGRKCALRAFAHQLTDTW